MTNRTSEVEDAASLWPILFQLHTAFQRDDVAEASTLLIGFPDHSVTREHCEIACDYMFAMARLAEDNTDFSRSLRDSYRRSYADSYARTVSLLAEVAGMAPDSVARPVL